jgi:hypothetical protein
MQTNTYMLKLLPKVVIAGTEALVSENKFLYVCIKEDCHPWAQPRFDIFHQILIIVEVLWSKPMARSEIRAVRMVVKQLPVEMFQQCSSVSSCMRTHIVMEKHYTGYRHFTPYVLNGWHYAVSLVFCNTLLNSLWSLVARIPPAALLSCPREQLPSAFWQTFV